MKFEHREIVHSVHPFALVAIGADKGSPEEKKAVKEWRAAVMGVVSENVGLAKGLAEHAATVATGEKTCLGSRARRTLLVLNGRHPDAKSEAPFVRHVLGGPL